MIKYIEKDITTVTEGIVFHGCNEKKKMGSGVALAIRNKWPQVYQRYLQHCSPKHHGTADVVNIDDKLYVANCYTQNSYGYDGQRYADPDAIKTSLTQLLIYADVMEIGQLYGPKIGCGLGGLRYEEDVKPIFENLSLAYPHIELNVCDLPNTRPGRY